MWRRGRKRGGEPGRGKRPSAHAEGPLWGASLRCECAPLFLYLKSYNHNQKIAGSLPFLYKNGLFFWVASTIGVINFHSAKTSLVDMKTVWSPIIQSRRIFW